MAALTEFFSDRTLPIKGLEIGCGNGWWLEICNEFNIPCLGVEPERKLEKYHKEHHLQVYYEFYPCENLKDLKFDFIIFNDVFEHIPNIDQLAQALSTNLKDDGLLIINIPMSDGFFYRTASFLNAIGIRSFLERMWQFNFHSPHIHYFNAHNVKSFFKKHSFVCLNEFSLETLNFSHLKERIVIDHRVSKFKAYFIGFCIKLMKPVIENARPDIKVFFFKKDFR